jgi:hypothetical protein
MRRTTCFFFIVKMSVLLTALSYGGSSVPKKLAEMQHRVQALLADVNNNNNKLPQRRMD